MVWACYLDWVRGPAGYRTTGSGSDCRVIRAAYYLVRSVVVPSVWLIIVGLGRLLCYPALLLSLGSVIRAYYRTIVGCCVIRLFIIHSSGVGETIVSHGGSMFVPHHFGPLESIRWW